MSRPLRVAIVHYHLKRGGVTRVIESTLRGFEQEPTAPQCVVLAGQVPNDFSHASLARCVPGLRYSNDQEATPAPQELLEQLRTAAEDTLGAPPDIWHIHNHSLGKNSSVPGLISLLAQEGARMLLHMHDFAEDGRPENYKLNQLEKTYSDHLYPDMDTVHYGVLNARDHAIYKATGIPDARLHLLGNPVESSLHPERDKEAESIRKSLNARKLYLYPVRAVRRKNFGELLYWAALAEPGDVFITTLGPTNKNFVEAYERWKNLAQKWNLPVEFSVAEQHDWPFESIMAAADQVISTSIAEGFGLAFLEPWLFNKGITGRDLPSITQDFKEHGITLHQCYQALPVPKSWVDSTLLSQYIQKALQVSYEAYETKLPDDALNCAIAAITPMDGYYDFGGLNEDLQESVIEKLVKDRDAKEALPVAELPPPLQAEQIDRNARRIEKSYSLSGYCDRILSIYQVLENSSPGKAAFLNAKTVLKGFLSPERLRLLRT
ncbi:hypothetical protein [Coraliomargarita parva]|uniref:hypothetical protein n=1 Tax=Coraliomargarita parva TaxID=3014050 RepID=UPI0022B417D8|nr:hypothetical protein [Coraliomargarita parva]